MVSGPLTAFTSTHSNPPSPTMSTSVRILPVLSVLRSPTKGTVPAAVQLTLVKLPSWLRNRQESGPLASSLGALSRGFLEAEEGGNAGPVVSSIQALGDTFLLTLEPSLQQDWEVHALPQPSSRCIPGTLLPVAPVSTTASAPCGNCCMSATVPQPLAWKQVGTSASERWVPWHVSTAAPQLSALTQVSIECPARCVIWHVPADSRLRVLKQASINAFEPS
jgi:hypothetical protein